MDHDIFLSIGTPSTENEEKSLDCLTRVLESRGLRRRSPLFSHKAPLISIRETLDACDGMIVVAYPRIHVEKGVERPDSAKETLLRNVEITTPWNHIEAAFAYDRGLPLMVLRDKSVKVEGFVEYAFDWQVKEIEFSEDYMRSDHFAAMVNEFAKQIDDYSAGRWKRFAGTTRLDLANLSIRDTVLNLKWPVAWKLLGVAAVLLGAVFYAGHKFGGFFYGAG